jgi:C_GCAxxG_C_C family probable redox protein
MLTVGEQILGGLDQKVLKITSIFGGGLAGTRQELCGALSAGAMIISMLYGRASLAEDEQLARQMVKTYRERFLAEYGTTQCSPLRDRYAAPDGSTNCGPLVERAALLLQELLAQSSR